VVRRHLRFSAGVTRRGARGSFGLLVAVAVVGASGCGGDGASEEQARETTAAFLRAYASIDPAFCGLMSTNSQEQLVLSVPATAPEAESCADVVASQAEGLSSAGPHELLNADAVRAAADDIAAADFALNGGSARLIFPAEADGSTDGPLYVDLALEAGEWRVSDVQMGSG